MHNMMIKERISSTKNQDMGHYDHVIGIIDDVLYIDMEDRNYFLRDEGTLLHNWISEMDETLHNELKEALMD